MSLYRIELATPADDADLRAVLATTPMPGMISIGLRVEPNFFEAAGVDGHFRQLIIARENATGRMAGFGSRSIGLRYVNGQATPTGYLSMLRMLKAHRGKHLLVRGFSFFRQLHQDRRTCLYLTTIAQDNTAARAILAARRAGLPAYHPAGLYHTAALPLKRRNNASPTDKHLEIRPAGSHDFPAIIEFLNRVGPQRQFFPCYEPEDFFSADGLLRDLKIGDILLAIRDGHIAGLFAGWDQHRFRQQVIHGYGQPLRGLRPLYNLWARLRGRPRLPEPGAALRCLMGALPLVADDDPEVFSALLGKMACQRSGRGWDYLLVGMHESDPLLKELKKWPARWYTTCLYVVCWEDGEAARRALDARPLYLELGSL